ncbi:hypothetical protein DRO97_04640 [Archaeoglobales archaeon]|nr:MAG: hypothetical protein DRO97_04640 [Archaeoglobales archaeon]
MIVFGILLIMLFRGDNITNFDEGNWFSYNEGLKVAHVENKPLFIFISSPTCPYCTKMKKDVFSDPEVISYLKTNFVPVYIDVGREKPPFNIISFPAYMIVYNESIIDSWTGYMPKEMLLERLKTTKI